MKPNTEPTSLRDLLFGDLPLGEWGKPGESTEPWSLFQQVKQAVDLGHNKQALAILHTIKEKPGLASRHYLQAYHFLDQLGHEPPAQKKLFGVVIEVGLDDGLDIVAAYEDHTARYYNFSGNAVIVESPTPGINEKIDTLLAFGTSIMNKIGPWDDERPPAPAKGNVRINLLTSNRLHFGEGPINVLFNDPMGSGILNAAFELMEALIHLDYAAKGIK